MHQAQSTREPRHVQDMVMVSSYNEWGYICRVMSYVSPLLDMPAQVRPAPHAAEATSSPFVCSQVAQPHQGPGVLRLLMCSYAH